MTKRKYNKPKSPEAIMTEAAIRRAQVAETDAHRARVETLKRQEEVEVREVGNRAYAKRLDVFELLRTRKRGPKDRPVQILPETHYEAIRELEAAMAVMLGQDRPGASGERVDGKKYPPGQNIADTQVDAGRVVGRWLLHIGQPHAHVLAKLIEKPHGVLTRWRDTVQAYTGLKGDDGQVDFILTACARASTYAGQRRVGRERAEPETAGQRSLGEMALDRVA